MNTKFIGGILLVAGTAIGAGMLALPVLTGMAGFYPSFGLFILVWLGTIFTALLVLEVNLWFPGDINLITMVNKTLGRKWAAVIWVAFLLLLYSLTAAYLAGGGRVLSDSWHLLTGQELPGWFQPLPFFVLFGTFIYFGVKPVDYLNRLIMLGLALGYVALIAAVAPHVQTQQLDRWAPSFLWGAIPVIVTSFGFHVLIPILSTYLDRDVKALRKVIFIGSGIPLLVYVLLEWVVLGTLPVDHNDWFLGAMERGDPVTRPLALMLQNPWISTFAHFFSFCALVTSFLGITLSLSSFLEDGLKMDKTKWARLWVTLLTFVPPLLFVWLFPRGFIMALQYAGIFVALISGILPALMAWKGRYLMKIDAEYRVRGGKASLVLAVLCSLMVIVLQIALELKLIS